LDDQVRLFSNAAEIIGFHGAGLANLVFCNDDVKVIEIVDRDCVYPSYIDGLVIAGEKATRTYFHMVAHMKNLFYQAFESENYYLDIRKLEQAIRNQ
jgi:capsular polysaccharide biosynthesis protein